ncbi:MAG: DNA gyrase/topoisomerase IV subunit B, partial [Acidimicrobiales bacterium]
IQTLEGLEAVRKRPGMYIGGTGSAGLMHLLWELIDNAVDEAAAGFCDRVEVILHRDGSMEVIDNGRGIPIGKHKKRKVSALEVVLTELHAGGKFGGGAYGASGGLHGVGASVVNALSSKLIAEVDRDGNTNRLCFKDRVAGQFNASGDFRASHTLQKVKKTRKTGSRIRFWPDLDVFDPAASISFDLICERVARTCFVVPGLKVWIEDKRPGQTNEPFEYVSRGGLSDLVESLTIGDPVTEIITVSGISSFEEKVPVDAKMTIVERECSVEIALRWVKGYETNVVSYVNTIPTTDGGTHLAGFDRALTRSVNDSLLAGTKKLAKLAKAGNDRATKEDVQEGLVAGIKVTFAEPQFRGQTKQELGTPAIQGIVYDIAKRELSNWFDGEGKKSHINAVRDKITQAILNRVASKEVLDAKRKAANLGSTGMPDKLADCRTHGDDSELLIVEGDSAAGPAKAGRNSEFMAILPLRGKVVNAGKATMKQVIDNTEAQALITAIGAGSGRDFKLEDARYGRIIILCDADVDGSHIRCLLLTLMYHYMRPMLEAGRVFAAQPPLYSSKWRGTTYYAFTDDERDQIATDHKIPLDKWLRFKGLGEMDVDELTETTLDPETRILKRMTMDDAKQAQVAAEMFETLMGSDVSARREFLLSNSDLIDRDSLDI